MVGEHAHAAHAWLAASYVASYKSLFSDAQSLTFTRVLLRAQMEVPSRERKHSGKIFDRRQALANEYCTKWRTYG